MRRNQHVVIALSLLVVAACSGSDSATDDSSAPATTDDTTLSSEVSEASSDVASTGDASTESSSVDTTGAESQFVELPGLLDASDEPVENDADVRTGTLENGLQYYVRHNERPGAKAQLRLAIKAGSVNETGANTGVAHFVEHMLFNGTEEYPKNELIDVLRSFGAAFGADVNAYTSFDETVYELDVPSADASLEAGMTILEQWLSHATFDADQVESERGVVLDEWRQSTQTAGGRLFEIAQGLYLAGSPYEGRDPIGSDESISTMPREELVEFYDNWYRPDNAGIVVVGDIDVDEVVADIEERFGSEVARIETPPAKPDTAFPIDTEPAFALHSDPDQTTVDVEVDLPIPAFESEGTAGLRASVLDSMIFDSLIRRLDQDVSAGTAPFDEIMPGSNTFVASLDAPALYAMTTAERVDDTLQALLDEYERASRFGFTAAETELAKASIQSQLDTLYEGRDTTQDADFAAEYVENFLSGAPFPSADDAYEIGSAEIAAITPEALDMRFRARWSNSAPHVIISTPEADAAAMPSEAEVLEAIAAVGQRDLEPRGAGRDLPDELMTAPEPIAPTSEEHLRESDDFYFDPVEITFPNGVRVIGVSNDIVKGQIGFQAISPGGSSLIADEDVVDALFAPDIVMSSGVSEFNQTELEQILADRDVQLAAGITPYSDGFSGSAATADVETLMQLVHLYMTQPRFDPVGLNQLRSSVGPLVADPSTDPDNASYDALLDARYGGELRYTSLPSVEEFESLDLEGVERVWRDRFGDAGDWVFVFAGDVDLDELFDLSARYLATLPGTTGPEQWVDVAPPPPTTPVTTTVNAGTGDASSATLLFTGEVTPDEVDAELRANLDVMSEVLTTRLTDVVREELGESYSPYAYAFVTSDPTPVIQTFIQITGDPERIAATGDLVIEELADLAANGPTEREFSGAFAQVQESYNFVDNGTFLTELTDNAMWPGFDLDDYVDRYRVLDQVTAGSVQQFIAANLPATAYVQVTVLPR